jgi:hypothetical protein
MVFSHCSGMDCLRKEICCTDVIVECNTFELSDGTLRNIPRSEFNVPIRYSETHPLKGNHTLRVFNIRILREIFRSNKKKLTG